MPSKYVADWSETWLLAHWTAAPVIPYDTQSQPPDNAEAFVVLQFPVANGVRAELGRTFFEEGAIRIVLNVVRGVGLAQGLLWADELSAIFRGVRQGSIETFAPDGPVIDDTIEEGNWVMYSIIVPYRYQFVAAVYEPMST